MMFAKGENPSWCTLLGPPIIFFFTRFALAHRHEIAAI
jgi:hypothetical protein